MMMGIVDVAHLAASGEGLSRDDHVDREPHESAARAGSRSLRSP